MCSVGKLLATHYKDVDLDLLLTGIILHDVGKIHELSYDRSFGYSTEGQLLGHIVIGLRIIGDKLQSLPDFPQRLRTLVEHLMLSHHGELEFGSPKLPMFPEALLLHQIDNLDSKMDCMRRSLSKDRHVEGCWTGYNPALDRPLLKKQRFLHPELEPPVTPQPDAARVSNCSPPSPVSQAVASPSHATPKSSSAFGDKLQNALRRND